MTTRRAILLDALDAWRREGALDEATHRFLRSRYESAPPSAELDAPLASAAPAREGGKRGFAADAMQFVGGLLLGAALVALVVFLDLREPVAPWTMAALGGLLLVPAALAAWRGAPDGLVEAGLAGGLIPLAVASGVGIDSAEPLLPALVAVVCSAIVASRRAWGPSTVVAAATFAFATAAATVLSDGFLDEPGAAARWAWFGAVVGFGALLLAHRARLWGSVALGLFVLPLSLAFLLLVGLVEDLTSVGVELALGAFLGALLGIGIAVGSRGLVAGAAAGLTIDAIVFAFDVGGPGTAVVVLLLLGGLLVWQAESVRSYFRARRTP